LTSATSATSEGAQRIFSKVTFLKSVHSKEKDEACLGFLVKVFTESLHRGIVSCVCWSVKRREIPGTRHSGKQYFQQHITVTYSKMHDPSKYPIKNTFFV
jgi:hypothetical protein